MTKLREQPEDEIITQLLGLYGRYVEEWDDENVRNTVVRPILQCQNSCEATSQKKEQVQWTQMSLM